MEAGGDGAVGQAVGADGDGAEALGFGGGKAGGDDAVDAAAAGMGDGDERARAAAAGGPAEGVHAGAGGAERVFGLVALDEGVVAGVEAVEDGGVAFDEVDPGGAEGRAAEVADEDVEGGDVAPAVVAGAETEIVFLAIALGEDVLTEGSDLVEAVAAEVEAEAYADGDVDDVAGVCLLGEGVQRGGFGEVGDGVGSGRVWIEVGVADDGAVVGEGSDGADVWRAVGGSAEAVEPAGGDEGVAVEQDGVAAGGVMEPGVRGGGEAGILGQADEDDAAAGGEVVEGGGEGAVGGGIVDDDEAGFLSARGAGEAGEDGVEAGEGFGGTPVDGDDDVDEGLAGGRRHGGGAADGVGPDGGEAWAWPGEEGGVEGAAEEVAAVGAGDGEGFAEGGDVGGGEGDAAGPGQGTLEFEVFGGGVEAEGKGAVGAVEVERGGCVGVGGLPGPAGERAGLGCDEALDADEGAQGDGAAEHGAVGAEDLEGFGGAPGFGKRKRAAAGNGDGLAVEEDCPGGAAGVERAIGAQGAPRGGRGDGLGDGAHGGREDAGADEGGGGVAGGVAVAELVEAGCEAGPGFWRAEAVGEAAEQGGGGAVFVGGEEGAGEGDGDEVVAGHGAVGAFEPAAAVGGVGGGLGPAVVGLGEVVPELQAGSGAAAFGAGLDVGEEGVAHDRGAEMGEWTCLAGGDGLGLRLHQGGLGGLGGFEHGEVLCGFGDACFPGGFQQGASAGDVLHACEVADEVAAEHQHCVGVLLCGCLLEPLLGSDAVGGDVVAAAQHGAHGELCAGVVAVGGALEHDLRAFMVAGAAAAVDHHFGQCDLGFEHAGFGGALDPVAAFGGVRVDPPALGKHAAVPELCVDDAVGSAAEPFGGGALVALNADALGQADAEVEGGDEVATAGGFLEPFAGADAVLFGPRTLEDELGEAAAAFGVAAFGGDAEPLGGFVGVAGEACAGEVEHGQRAGGEAVAFLGGAGVPGGGFGVVGRQVAAAAGVDVADHGGGLGVAGEGGAAEPAFALDEVLVDAAALEERHAPAGHALADTEGCGAFIELCGTGGVALHAGPGVEHGGEEVDAEREAGLGGAGHLDGGGGAVGVGLRVAEHGEREAHGTLGTSGGGGSGIPLAGFRKVAQRVGAGGEEVADEGLGIGGAGVGGGHAPAVGAVEVGLHLAVVGEDGGDCGRAPCGAGEVESG